MRSRYLIIALVAAASLASLAFVQVNKTITASSKRIEKTLSNPSVFSKISVAGSHEVEFTGNSGGASVRYSVPENLAEYADVYVKDGTLYVSYKKNMDMSIRGDHSIKVYASGRGVSGVAVAGSGKVDISRNNAVDPDFNVSVSGSGKVTADGSAFANNKLNIAGSGRIVVENIKSDRLNASVSGSGGITVSGTSEEATLNVSGSGYIKAGDLNSNVLNVSVSGSGEITTRESTGRSAQGKASFSISGSGEINVSEISSAEVTGKVTGSGVLKMSGNAEKVKMSLVGSGRIEAGEMHSRSADVSVSGSGKIACHASETLNANTSGSGMIYYGGNPAEIYISGKRENVRKL